MLLVTCLRVVLFLLVHSGCLAGCLHVAPGTARIRRGTRVAQFLLVEAETLGAYAGDYGKGKAHDAKYETPVVAREAPGTGTPLDGARRAAKASARRPTPKRATSLDRPVPVLVPAPPFLGGSDLENGDSSEGMAAAPTEGKKNGAEGVEALKFVIAGLGADSSNMLRHLAARTTLQTAAIVVLQIEVVCLLVWCVY